MIDIDPSCADFLRAANIAPGIAAGSDHWGWGDHNPVTSHRAIAAIAAAYMHADLLIGCQAGKPVVFTTLQGSGWADPSHPKEWTQALVACTDREAAEAYLADRGRDDTAMQFIAVSELIRKRPNPERWYKLMRPLLANLVVINPSGPLSTFVTIPEPHTISGPSMGFGLTTSDVPWSDADERKQIRAKISDSFARATAATDAGDIDAAKRIIDAMDTVAPFVDCRAAHFATAQHGLWNRAAGDLRQAWQHLRGAGFGTIMFGFPEDSATYFIQLCELLIDARTRGVDDPAWVRQQLHSATLELKIVKPRDYDWRPELVTDVLARSDSTI